MSDNELGAFITLMVTIAFTIPTTVWAWSRRGRQRELKPGSTISDERLARIEQAVDAMAIEIERISEGQRFTTKLLAERGGAAASLPSAPPSDKRP